MEGWIKLHRKLKDHWIWKSDNRLKWWIDILMTVNHNDTKVLIKGTLIECKRGQSIRSLESWGRDWNVTKGAVRDFFRLLQNDSMIHTESLQITTRITVCNYEDYQAELHAKETQKKRNTNGKETLGVHKQEVIDESITKEGEESKQLTWRDDFEIYKFNLDIAYNQIMDDSEFIKSKEEFYPNIDIKLSIKKAYIEFWSIKAGWKNKKTSKSKELDWYKTFSNAIGINKVYKQKQDNNKPQYLTPTYTD